MDYCGTTRNDLMNPKIDKFRHFYRLQNPQKCLTTVVTLPSPCMLNPLISVNTVVPILCHEPFFSRETGLPYYFYRSRVTTTRTSVQLFHEWNLRVSYSVGQEDPVSALNARTIHFPGNRKNGFQTLQIRSQAVEKNLLTFVYLFTIFHHSL